MLSYYIGIPGAGVAGDNHCVIMASLPAGLPVTFVKLIETHKERDQVDALTVSQF